jgi:hypothetical protein
VVVFLRHEQSPENRARVVVATSLKWRAHTRKGTQKSLR